LAAAVAAAAAVLFKCLTVKALAVVGTPCIATMTISVRMRMLSTGARRTVAV